MAEDAEGQGEGPEQVPGDESEDREGREDEVLHDSVAGGAGQPQQRREGSEVVAAQDGVGGLQG